ncbi:hypothetical protein DNTS_031954 [Danionella cerebrum]|uniref:Iodothyronine deiodinase n=1 Tax=Danionella cerebrum TaxID=2873325 RepID=A0A553PEE3_9TELE|nr:hypothetical protein DNTS_031954 [Danionella translucida]
MGTAIGFAVRKLWVYMSAVLMVCLAILQMSLLKLLSFFSPGLMRKIHLRMGERSTMTQNPKFKYEDWGPTFFSWAFIKAVLGVNWCSLGIEAFEGHAAPDTALFTINGEKTSVHRFLKDAWAFANNVDISVHKTLEERLSAARTLVKENPLCTVVVDQMSNITASKYGALPERLYVIQSGRVIYQGGVGPWGYKPEEVKKVLEKVK